MPRKLALAALALGGATFAAPATADPAICVGALTEVEILLHVRQDAYFIQQPLDGRSLRVEYDGCGYRVHVGESTPRARDGDLLLVDRYGHVTRVVHLRQAVTDNPGTSAPYRQRTGLDEFHLGTLTVQFPDCNSMHFSFQANAGLPDGVPQGSGTRDWVRLTGINGLACN